MRSYVIWIEITSSRTAKYMDIYKNFTWVRLRSLNRNLSKNWKKSNLSQKNPIFFIPIF